MSDLQLIWGMLDFVMLKVALFAAAGFLVLGAGDVLLDLAWLVRAALSRPVPTTVATLPPPAQPGRLAIFIPAWQEAQVIGKMLRHAVATFDHQDYWLYIGCYPNDPDTIAVVRAIGDERIRLVVGPVPGPTTKADCLNRVWEAMLADEAASGIPYKAVVLHDAEDVIHPAELKLFDRMIEAYDLVQLPVVPLIDEHSRWIAGHYADEFAEAHGKELVVRDWVGAALPSAGVGCAFSREAMRRLARLRGGAPFDADSLTEDYELGLRLGELGGRSAFVRMRAEPGGSLVVTKEYFPGSLHAAVGQKARWMTGIALSGWERLGWGTGLAEFWMRLRDRQSMLAAILLCAAYAGLVLWVAAMLRMILGDVSPPEVPPVLAAILSINALMLLWRLAMRFAFVASTHGLGEGLRSVPRMIVGNIIAMLAARRAVGRYLRMRRDGGVHWDKTMHNFPQQVPAE